MLFYNIGKVYKPGKLNMEQQKITQKPLPNSQSNINIIDITNTNQKTLRSLHNISSSNIQSKSKLTPGTHFVISYNFQNDPNSQVRTHNLLIGLNQISQSHPKKNTFRKNAILRSNHISNSHSNLRNSRNSSEDFRNKLIHVRSNQILSSQHKKQETTTQSVYTKNGKLKDQAQSHTHGNTFWNDRNNYNEGRKNHEKYINRNVTKIAQRSTNNMNNGQFNGVTNQIKKINRGKLNRPDKIGQKQNTNLKVLENRVYDVPNFDILERDQLSRLSKRSNKQGQYNDKLQNILRKVKRSNTRQNLKQAYVKQQPLQQTSKLSPQPKTNFSPKTKSIHETHLNNNIKYQNEKSQHSSQQQYQEESSNTINFLQNHYDPLKNQNSLSKIDSASEVIYHHQKSLIERQNYQKPKRKYHNLIKNPKSNNKDSLLEQFHRIQSENQNELGSSKKPSKQQIQDKSLPDKSIDYSINGHLNENVQQKNLVPENKQGLILQKLQFNNNPSKQPQNNNLTLPQKSLKQRYNYHAPTTYERNHNNRLSHDRQRLNSTNNYNHVTPNNEKEGFNTKRKAPVDYKEFLRLLSQENERKKQIEEMERQRQLSLNAQKTSRFHNIEQQNQHIKRILTPIGNSFMDERRKRLSDERKSKRKQKRQQFQNFDGSIIQSDSQSSQDVRRSYSKKLAQKNKKNHSKALSNLQPSTHPKKKNLYQSLLSSIEKINKNSQQNSKNVSRSSNQNKLIQEKNSKAKLNEADFSNRQEEPIQEQSAETIIDKKANKMQDKIKKIAGIKIPQGAIERAKSKRLFRKKDDTNPKNKKATINNGLSDLDQNTDSDANKTKNKFAKNIVSSKKTPANQLKPKSSQLNNQQTSSNPKIDKNGKIKPVDKRNAQQKVRKLKNWNESQKQQNDKKQKGLNINKDKNTNQKNWKETQKQNNKKIKQKNRESQEEDEQQSFKQNHGLKPVQKKQITKKAKKANQKMSNNKGESFQVENSNQESSEDQRSKQNTLTDENEDQQQSNNKVDPEQNVVSEISKPGVQKQNNRNRESVTVKTNQAIKNEPAQDNLKKQSLPSIHQNIQSLEKNNLRLSQQAQRESLKNSISHSNPSEKQASISSQLQKQKHQNSSPLNVNCQEVSNPNILQKKTGNSLHSQSQKKAVPNQKNKSQPKRQSSETKHVDNLDKHLEDEKKQQMIQNVIENKEMQQNGFMEITESKFDVYNHESEKSFAQNSLQQIPEMEPEELEKRAEIVKFLYSLPSEYQQEISKFIPNESESRLINQKSFSTSNLKLFKSIKVQSLKTAMEQLLIFDHLNPKFDQKKIKGRQDLSHKNSFLSKLFEPYPNLKNEVGIWMYCVGVWRLITVRPKSPKIDEQTLLQSLQKAFETALKNFYSNLRINQIKHEQILRMLTGLKISTFTNTKRKNDKIFRQIEYNTRKKHIIQAISTSQSKFSKDTIICVRKIQSTPTGEKVLQVVSTSTKQIEKKPNFFWIREDKFLQFFTSFTIISRRSSDSYWTNDSINIKNQQKAVYMIDSTQKHTSGSITLYPTDKVWGSAKQKCTIAFYKQIEPQVLKLVGKAMERIPQSKDLVHTSKLYFEFNIKGTYYVFLQLEDGIYNVAIESNNHQTKLQFVEFVKKETNKNDQCEYVEIDKIIKKKAEISTFQNSSEFRQLMNFMKKTSPQVYQAK